MATTTGTLTSVSNGAAVNVTRGSFVVDIYGTFVGTARLERRVDGTNWVPMFYLNTAHSRTAPASETFHEGLGGAQYRVACTAYTSGTISWSIRQD